MVQSIIALTPRKVLWNTDPLDLGWISSPWSCQTRDGVSSTARSYLAVGAGARFHACAVTLGVGNVGWWWVPGSLRILQGFQAWAQFGFIRRFLLLAHFSVLN